MNWLAAFPRLSHPGKRPRTTRRLRMECLERRSLLAGITVTPTSGLTTTESGGTASFSVVLDSLPLANVTIILTSSQPTEGTLSAASVTFNLFNWNQAQSVTVQGIDDAIDDGDRAFSIITGAAQSLDFFYNGLSVADVAVGNLDNDTAGINVSAISGPTSEAGGTATFSVALNSQPTADVTITLASNDLGEGTTNVASLTFTAANWNVAQVVTVTGVDDLVADGDLGLQHRHGGRHERRWELQRPERRRRGGEQSR